MTVCEVCDGKDFECIDGLFYCLACQTQTQDVREEEQEDFIEGLAAAGLALIPKAKQGHRQQSTNKVVDRGRPWMTHEAFQFVIQAQVKALIKLGAHPKLQETVFKMWALYLQKTGVAFGDEDRSVEKCMGRPGPIRERDKYLGATVDDPVVKPIRLLASHKRTLGARMSTRAARKKQEQSMMEEAIAHEAFYEGDNPLQQEVDGGETDKVAERLAIADEETQREHNKEKTSHYSRGYNQTRVERMTLLHTVSLCQLGLLYTNNLVQPSDLVRWIIRGDLAYNKANAILPSDMKSYMNDRHMFSNPDPPSADRIRVVAGKLFVFLDFKELPPVNLAALASKYIIQLNLPADLHAVVSMLIRHRPCILHGKRAGRVLPNVTCIALAYIIITLKALFGLNDHTEWELTVYARELASVVDTQAQSVFVWSDWVSATERTLRTGRSLVDSKQFDAKCVEDVSTFAQHCRSSIEDRVRRVTRSKQEVCLKPEIQSSIQGAFSSLLEGVHHQQSHQKRPKSSNSQLLDQHLSAASPTLMADPLQSMGMDEGISVCQQSPVSPDAKDLRYSTIRYILQQTEFLDQLGDSCNATSRHKDFSDEELFDPSQDLFIPDEYPSQRSPLSERLSTAHPPLHSSAAAAKQGLSPEEKRNRLTALRNALDDLPQGLDHYTLYTQSRFAADCRHESYIWLINAICEQMSCQPQTLDYFVRMIEYAVVVPFHEIPTADRHAVKHFCHRYFH